LAMVSPNQYYAAVSSCSTFGAIRPGFRAIVHHTEEYSFK
jgi:hypothetical protein